MGLLFDFYAGPGSEIVDAYAECDFDRLEDLARGHADLSLHISPRDVDILSEQAFRIVGKDPVSVFDSFAPEVWRTESGDAHVMHPQWVSVIADVPDSSIDRLVDEWIGVAGQEAGATVTVSAEARKAVHDLVALCRTAKRENLDVVFTSSL